MWVRRHPDPFTLAQVSESQSSPGPEWEEMTAEAFAAWRTAEIEAGWSPAVPVANLELPDAERYQVRAWLLRMAHEHDRPELHPDQIPAYITSITAPGLEREEALDRWANVSRVPANHPLVQGIAASLGLNVADIWPGILAL